MCMNLLLKPRSSFLATFFAWHCEEGGDKKESHFARLSTIDFTSSLSRFFPGLQGFAGQESMESCQRFGLDSGNLLLKRDTHLKGPKGSLAK